MDASLNGGDEAGQRSQLLESHLGGRRDWWWWWLFRV